MTSAKTSTSGHISLLRRHLLELINEILDLSKVEAGQMELDLDPARDQPVGPASRWFASPPPGTDDHPYVNIELKPRHAHADERKLKTLFVNLLSNAVKFTPTEAR